MFRLISNLDEPQRESICANPFKSYVYLDICRFTHFRYTYTVLQFIQALNMSNNVEIGSHSNKLSERMLTGDDGDSNSRMRMMLLQIFEHEDFFFPICKLSF